MKAIATSPAEEFCSPPQRPRQTADRKPSPAATPSIPSIRLKAFTIVTTQSTVSGSAR